MVEGAGYIAGESMRNDTKQTIEPDRLCYRSLVNECGPIGAEHEPSAIYIVTEREPEAGLLSSPMPTVGKPLQLRLSFDIAIQGSP
jgi:hypothetical protein